MTWHFVGKLQANKTRDVAETFDWVHTVDRLKIAERLSEQRSPFAAPLNVLIQVNQGGETQKGGARPKTSRSWREPSPRCRGSRCAGS